MVVDQVVLSLPIASEMASWMENTGSKTIFQQLQIAEGDLFETHLLSGDGERIGLCVYRFMGAPKLGRNRFMVMELIGSDDREFERYVAEDLNGAPLMFHGCKGDYDFCGVRSDDIDIYHCVTGRRVSPEELRAGHPWSPPGGWDARLAERLTAGIATAASGDPVEAAGVATPVKEPESSRPVGETVRAAEAGISVTGAPPPVLQEVPLAEQFHRLEAALARSITEGAMTSRGRAGDKRVIEADLSAAGGGVDAKRFKKSDGVKGLGLGDEKKKGGGKEKKKKASKDWKDKKSKKKKS